MPETCPKCGAVNQSGRSTCIACGAELEIALFAEMFGPPRQIKGRYVVQRPLQQGASLSLYQAIDAQAGNRPCLVHQIAVNSLDESVREVLEYRFLEQVAAWRTRRHPNIIEILDADVQHRRLYLITAPVKGESLRSVIDDRQQTVPERTLLHWAGQICDALDYLHNQSPPVVLGCLSPGVIHIDETGHAQLVEVGLTRYQSSGLLGPARGIPGYAAPEQRRGELTPLSDLYTLGIILYEIITRFDPRERPLPSLLKYSRGIPELVASAISRAYRREPEKRYPSAAEMRRALLGTPAQPVPELPPFALSEGRTVTAVPDLVQLCVALWDEGLLALINGRIGEWLAAAALDLRRAGLAEDADEIDRIARRTLQAREEIEGGSDRLGMSGTAQETARHSAYAAWLRDLGALGVQPSLQVRPQGFDFGVIGATIRARSTLQITNKGQGYLTGRVESRVPWLTIPNPQFGCRAGETAQIRVEARGRTLPPGESRASQAIHVVSNGGDAWIEARASSSPPVLNVEPRSLNYGPITRGASRVAHLTVTNRGGGRLNGRVLSRAPWLRVRHPEFNCPSGASAQIAIELLSSELPARAVRIRRALAVDSDSGQAQVDVTWKWARPALELDTTGLDLGSVERGTQIERVLTLSNSGTADLVGSVRSQLPWLSVHPTEFRCPPHTSEVLTVRCSSALLPGGSTVEPEAIVIQANAGIQTLSASVEVLAPQLVIEPPQVELGVVWDGDQVEETVIVGNRGSLPWEGQIRAEVPWLTVEPLELRCEPGHFMPVTVMLHTEAMTRGGEWSATDGLRIVGQGEVRSLAVHATLLRPELMVERRALHFGLIGRTTVAALSLEIRNNGTGDLEWHIQTQGTWLEVIPASGTCGPGETTIVQVNGYALAVDGNSGQAWLTVHSNGGRADLHASVALSSPTLDAEPLSLDLESENYAPVSQPLTIFNRGVGDLEGTITTAVPWLTVAPQTFRCLTGSSIEVQVQANLEGAREGTLRALDAVLIESNGGNEVIGASLTLTLSPELHVSPQELYLDGLEERPFELENRGYGTLRVRVIPTEEWLAVNRQEWTVKPGKTVQVKARVLGAYPASEGTIEIHTAEEIISLTVHQTAAES